MKVFISLLILTLSVGCASTHTKVGESGPHKQHKKNTKSISAEARNFEKGVIRFTKKKVLFNSEDIASFVRVFGSDDELLDSPSFLNGSKDILELDSGSYKVVVQCSDRTGSNPYHNSYNTIIVELDKGSDYTFFCLRRMGSSLIGFNVLVELIPFLTKTENIEESKKKYQELVDRKK